MNGLIPCLPGQFALALGYNGGGGGLCTLALGHDGGGRGLRALALGHDGGSRGRGLLCLPDLGLCLTQLGLERLGIHPGQDLPGLDHITVIDQALCDAPRCFGRNVDLCGFDTPVADRKAVRKASRRELAPGEDATTAKWPSPPPLRAVSSTRSCPSVTPVAGSAYRGVRHASPRTPDETMTPPLPFTCRSGKKRATDRQECHAAPGAL